MPVIRVSHDFDPAPMPRVWRDSQLIGLAWRNFLAWNWTHDLHDLGKPTRP